MTASTDAASASGSAGSPLPPRWGSRASEVASDVATVSFSGALTGSSRVVQAAGRARWSRGRAGAGQPPGGPRRSAALAFAAVGRAGRRTAAGRPGPGPAAATGRPAVDRAAGGVARRRSAGVIGGVGRRDVRGGAVRADRRGRSGGGRTAGLRADRLGTGLGRERLRGDLRLFPRGPCGGGPGPRGGAALWGVEMVAPGPPGVWATREGA